MEVSEDSGKRSKILLIGVLILVVNASLWLYLLFEIKTIELPINCAGAWPDNLQMIVFTAFLLNILLSFIRSLMGNISKSVETPIMMESLLLFTFIIYSMVGAMCMCSDPSLVIWSYKVVAFLYVADSATKTFLLFSIPKSENV